MARKAPGKLRDDFFIDGNVLVRCPRTGTPKEGRGTSEVGSRKGACASPFLKGLGLVQNGPFLFSPTDIPGR
jgi:hypothetical protein